MKTDLLKEAIADADAIKKLAIENAKASLNQAFDSKVKSMLAARLQEEAEDENYEETSPSTSGPSMKEAKKKNHPKHDEETSSSSSSKSSKKGHEKEHSDDFDIDEILAEMEDSDSKEETPKDEEANYYKAKAGSGPHLDEESSTMDEEKTYYKAKAGSGPHLDEESTSGTLDENIEKSETEQNSFEKSYIKKEKAKEKGPKKYVSRKDSDHEREDEELDLKELLRELEEGSYEESYSSSKSSSKSPVKEAKKKHHKEESSSTPSKHEMEESWKDKAEAYKAELNEIKRLASKLTGKVNETNLINAKLLYLNKILNKHNLNETQKVRVIGAFDRATSINEAKIVFESLNGALHVKTAKTKTNLKESLGFASKAAGNSTKRDIISEADIQVARWQKLAGINKTID